MIMKRGLGTIPQLFCVSVQLEQFSKPYQALDGFFTSFALVVFLFILF